MRGLVRIAVQWLIRCGYRWTMPFIRGRGEFPYILNARRLLGEGAEIGVARGKFSAFILERWNGRLLYSIDPWLEFPKEEYRDAANVLQEKHECLFQDASERLTGFGTRSKIMRCTSEEAALKFGEGQLDFVYIDAQHHYDAVKKDLNLWYPKVRKGGILAGHDYRDGVLKGTEFGVRTAVDEFARQRNLRVTVSKDEPYPSWFIPV